jgi:putative copper resistance protein D
VIEPLIIAIRLAQYAAAAVLFGSAAFHLYAPVADLSPHLARRARVLLTAAAALLAVASLAAIAAQSVFFAGSMDGGLARESLSAVAFQMDLGKAALARAAAAIAALAVLAAMTPGRVAWALAVAFGGVATISLAWMGHAGAGEGGAGRILLASDVLHLLAVAGWVGALAGFVQLLFVEPATPAMARALHSALDRFATVGSLLVAILIVTGAVNTLSIVGPAGIATIWTSAYGKLLLLKLMLFATMLGLAALNRFRLTPALAGELDEAQPAPGALGSLRRSVILEILAGAAVLALVSWLGTLSPTAA